MPRAKIWFVPRGKFWVVLLATIGVGYGAWGQFGVLLGYEVEGAYFNTRDGVRMHYVVEGQGEPLILVHGFAMNIDLSWRKPGVLSNLSEEFQVIAYDARGHGLSDKPRGVERYGEAMVDDIVDLMDHLGIRRAHFIGQSMGGMTILKFVAKYPERVISASPNAIGWQRRDPLNLSTCEALAASLESGAGLRPLLERLQPTDGRMGQFTKATLDTFVGYINDNLALACVARALPELAVSKEDLVRNEVPVLTVIGSVDPLLGDAYELHETMRNHTLVQVDGADHFYLTDTEAYNTALTDFLRAHRETAAPAPEVGIGS